MILIRTKNWLNQHLKYRIHHHHLILPQIFQFAFFLLKISLFSKTMKNLNIIFLKIFLIRQQIFHLYRSFHHFNHGMSFFYCFSTILNHFKNKSSKIQNYSRCLKTHQTKKIQIQNLSHLNFQNLIKFNS